MMSRTKPISETIKRKKKQKTIASVQISTQCKNSMYLNVRIISDLVVRKKAPGSDNLQSMAGRKGSVLAEGLCTAELVIGAVSQHVRFLIQPLHTDRQENPCLMVSVFSLPSNQPLTSHTLLTATHASVIAQLV